MNRSRLKTISRLLILAGAALLAWAALSWFRGGKEVEVWKGKLAEQQTQIKATRTEASQLSLRYQAFMKSMSAVPDSVKLTSGKSMRETGRSYDASLRKLEMAERNLGLDISRSKRKLADAERTRKRATLPFAGAGAAAWLCAVLAAVAARGPRKAA